MRGNTLSYFFLIAAMASFTISSVDMLAQGEKVYLNNSLETCKKSKATMYMDVVQGSAQFDIQMYDMDDRLKMKGHSTDALGQNFNGKFEFYHPDGSIESRGVYMNGNKVGLWDRFSANGNMLAERNYAAFDAKLMAYTYVDRMPSFEGGSENFDDFLKQRLRPLVEELNKSGSQPTITLNFIVSERGKIEGLEIAKGIDPEWDVAAMEQLRSLPSWIPGKNKGEAVRVLVQLPIDLSL